MTVEEIMRTGFLMAASTIEKDVRLTDITENELSGLFTAQLKSLADAGYAVAPVEPTEEMLDVFHDQIRIEALPHKKQCRILNDKYIYKAMIETGAHKV